MALCQQSIVKRIIIKSVVTTLASQNWRKFTSHYGAFHRIPILKILQNFQILQNPPRSTAQVDRVAGGAGQGGGADGQQGPEMD